MSVQALPKATRLLSLATCLALALAVPACGTSGSLNAESSSAPTRAQRDSIEWLLPNRPIPGLSQRAVGSADRAAVVLWTRGRPPSRDVVVFLHGWLKLPPFAYRAWLRHLADQGNTIVYPVIGGADDPPEGYLDNALPAIARALEETRARPETLVAIGETTGGALAFDYAALAAQRGIPPPRGVFAAFPGRHPGTGTLEPADLSRIPPRTELAVLGGIGNEIPHGDEQARALLAASSRVPVSSRRFLSAPRLGRAPALRDDPLIRRALWASADRLIARARTAP